MGVCSLGPIPVGSRSTGVGFYSLKGHDMEIKGLNGRLLDPDEMVIVRDRHTGRPVTKKISDLKADEVAENESAEPATETDDGTGPDQDII